MPTVKLWTDFSDSHHMTIGKATGPNPHRTRQLLGGDSARLLLKKKNTHTRQTNWYTNAAPEESVVLCRGLTGAAVQPGSPSHLARAMSEQAEK